MSGLFSNRRDNTAIQRGATPAGAMTWQCSFCNRRLFSSEGRKKFRGLWRCVDCQPEQKK